jgi:hypothetical protein
MRNLILIVCLLFVGCFAANEAQGQVQWNPQCALESAQKFAACRASGGGNFGCLVTAGFHYWQCSGSTFGTRGPVRAAIVGRRAVRLSR